MNAHSSSNSQENQMPWDAESFRPRARRVPLQIPLVVSGSDQHGIDFMDQTCTENVSNSGGCLYLTRRLRKNQQGSKAGKQEFENMRHLLPVLEFLGFGAAHALKNDAREETDYRQCRHPGLGAEVTRHDADVNRQRAKNQAQDFQALGKPVNKCSSHAFSNADYTKDPAFTGGAKRRGVHG